MLFLLLMYGLGLALMAEAFMSEAYHICPSNANYQFDTTFVFVLAGLGLFKSCSPNHNVPSTLHDPPPPGSHHCACSGGHGELIIHVNCV